MYMTGKSSKYQIRIYKDSTFSSYIYSNIGAAYAREVMPIVSTIGQKLIDLCQILHHKHYKLYPVV